MADLAKMLAPSWIGATRSHFMVKCRLRGCSEAMRDAVE